MSINDDIMDDDEYFESAAHGCRPFSNFEWFAIDKEFNIAKLSSSGVGAIPKAVFSRTIYFELDFYIEVLSPIGGYYLSEYSYRDDVSYLKKMASCGIYIYDYDDTRNWGSELGQYDLLAIPEKPLNLCSIPNKFHDYLKRVQITESKFSDTHIIKPEHLFECNL